MSENGLLQGPDGMKLRISQTLPRQIRDSPRCVILTLVISAGLNAWKPPNRLQALKVSAL